MSAPAKFSESTVNDLIPQLEAIFERIDALEAEIGARANELERMGVQPGGSAEPSSESVQERRDYNHDKVLEYHREIKKIADLGGILDDLELKIVDFPATRDGQEIQLMWQKGESKVNFYRMPGAEFHQRIRLD